MNARGAVFLDRDGVLNHNWFNPVTKKWESPLHADDFRLREGVLDALEALQSANKMMFLVSNQPSAAKGKCSLADLASVQDVFAIQLASRNIQFADFFYSYSHPNAVVPGMTEPAHERKPNPYFLNHAIEQYGLERFSCWMVGDRGTDIECGLNAGVRTIQVKGSEDDGNAESGATPDFRVDCLWDAVRIILSYS